MKLRELDEIDLHILKILQRDGSMTYKEVAHVLRKSMSLIADRIRLLKSNGYIKATVALVDIAKVKTLFVAFPHVQLNNHAEDTLNQFQEEMMRHEEVMECYQLTGHFDFMLKIAMPDMTAYNKFLKENIGTLPYVGSIQSFLMLAESKHTTAYKL